MPAGHHITPGTGPGLILGAGLGWTIILGDTLPFHYGRWANVTRPWGWIPGPREVRPVYAPALVVFVGGGMAAGCTVGWFPLGPREVYVPSYRVSPAYVNRVNVSNTTVNQTTVTNVYNTTIINNNNNVTTINNARYVNRNVNGAVTAVPQRSFASAQPVAQSAIRVNPQQLRAMPVTARAAVPPARASVLGAHANTAGRVAAPPQAVATRHVIARTAPPPPPPSFAAREKLLAQHPGMAVPRQELAKLRPANAPESQVRIAPPARPAQPTPAPARAGQPANGRPGGNPPPANQPGANNRPGNNRITGERTARTEHSPRTGVRRHPIIVRIRTESAEPARPNRVVRRRAMIVHRRHSRIGLSRISAPNARPEPGGPPARNDRPPPRSRIGLSRISRRPTLVRNRALRRRAMIVRHLHNRIVRCRTALTLVRNRVTPRATIVRRRHNQIGPTQPVCSEQPSGVGAAQSSTGTRGSPAFGSPDNRPDPNQPRPNVPMPAQRQPNVGRPDVNRPDNRPNRRRATSVLPSNLEPNRLRGKLLRQRIARNRGPKSARPAGAPAAATRRPTRTPRTAAIAP